jgi:hypothetical protein
VDGRVRATFDQVPLKEAVAAVARAGGTEVVGAVDMSPAVTVTLEDVSLEEAFERLLAPESFLFVYDAAGRLRRVRILGGSGAFQFAAPEPTVAVLSPARLLPQDILKAEVEVSPESRLAQSLRSPSPTLRDIAQLALHSDDPLGRDEAAETAMGTIEGDPELHAALDLLLQNTDQQTLADQVRMAAGADASDLIVRVLRFTRRPDARNLLLELLKTLRSAE